MREFTKFINFFFRCGKDIVTFFNITIDLGGFSYVQFLTACLVLNILLSALVVRFTPSAGDFKPGKPPRKAKSSGGGKAVKKG